MTIPEYNFQEGIVMYNKSYKALIVLVLAITLLIPSLSSAKGKMKGPKLSTWVTAL